MLAIKAITLAQVLQLKTRAQGLSVILLFFSFLLFFFCIHKCRSAFQMSACSYRPKLLSGSVESSKIK